MSPNPQVREINELSTRFPSTFFFDWIIHHLSSITPYRLVFSFLKHPDIILLRKKSFLDHNNLRPYPPVSNLPFQPKVLLVHFLEYFSSHNILELFPLI